MLLTATISQQEFADFVKSMLPLRVDLSEAGDMSRYLEVSDIHEVEMVEGVGLVVAAPIEVHWPERQLLTEFRVERFRLVLTPKLESSPHGTALGVYMRCSDLAVSWVPKFIDALIAKQIDARVREMELGFKWDFSETLSFEVSEDSQRSTIASFDFSVASASLVVGSSALELLAPMKISLTRRRIKPVEIAPVAEDEGLHEALALTT